MSKWEYEREALRWDDDAIKKLNERGQDGWELAGLVPSPHGLGAVFYFKREIPDQPELDEPIVAEESETGPTIRADYCPEQDVILDEGQH